MDITRRQAVKICGFCRRRCGRRRARSGLGAGCRRGILSRRCHEDENKQYLPVAAFGRVRQHAGLPLVGEHARGGLVRCPDDIKPYAAIELHPAKVCKPTSCIPKDTPELRAWYKHMLDEAQLLGIPVFLVIMSAGERQTVPAEWLAEQFETYSVLRGAMNIENYWIYNDDLPTNAAKYLEVAPATEAISSGMTMRIGSGSASCPTRRLQTRRQNTPRTW